jgi:hypothetical protein
MKMTETQVNLNAHEIGIILSALQNVELADEMHIARDYGSVPALYDKLHALWEQVDTSQTGLRYDLTPSF